jgi:transposase-like protein/IS1 family transposase
MKNNYSQCPSCESNQVVERQKYQTKTNGVRILFKCINCEHYFSETTGTFMFDIKTPLSKIAKVIEVRTEGVGFNATCRLYKISPHTLQDWENRFGNIKEALFLYASACSFIEQVIEGDELYTKVNKKMPPHESEGWTVLLMDRLSRFIWTLSCGKRDKKLFEQAMEELKKVIKITGDLTLLTDGERRYGSVLFAICSELIMTGKAGRPKRTLLKGLKVRLKNKGSQTHKKGRKKPKYERPKPEHPKTKQNISNEEIHGNHDEGQNAALRRKLSAFRRQTNTYAKLKIALQRVLNMYWVVHNFVRKHSSTREVPAVKLGILKEHLSLEELLTNVRVAF